MSYEPALAYSGLKYICQSQQQSCFQLASRVLFREKKIAFKFLWLMGFGTFLNVYGRHVIVMLFCNSWGAIALHRIVSDKHEIEDYW